MRTTSLALVLVVSASALWACGSAGGGDPLTDGATGGSDSGSAGTGTGTGTGGTTGHGTGTGGATTGTGGATTGKGGATGTTGGATGTGTGGAGTGTGGSPFGAGGSGTGTGAGPGTGGTGSTVNVCKGQSSWACDPISSSAACMGKGSACDIDQNGAFSCFPAPNTVPVGGSCDAANGPYCAQGGTCLQGGTCARYCCTDADCGGSGSCQVVSGGNVTVTVGVCGPGGGTGGTGSGTGGSGTAGTSSGTGGAAPCTTDTWANFAQAFFKNDCTLSCHNHSTLGGQTPNYNLIKSNASNISSRISSGNMPQGTKLSASDKSRILKWLSCGEPM
jgi:hypothetical protein